MMGKISKRKKVITVFLIIIIAVSTVFAMPLTTKALAGELPPETCSHPTESSATRVSYSSDATCRIQGTRYETTYCTICGQDTATYMLVSTNPNNHINVQQTDTIVEQTCTNATVKHEKICSDCGTIIQTWNSEDSSKALDHNPGESVYENETEATCTEDGGFDTVVYCTRCSEQLSREHTTSEAWGHFAESPVEENRIESTCNVAGSFDLVTYCSTCGEAILTEHINMDPLRHIECEPIKENDTRPTCTTDGYYDMVVYCELCNNEVSRERTVLPATGHTPSEEKTENKIDPWCTTDGSYETVKYCTTCNAEVSRTKTVIPALGHAGTVLVNAKETSNDAEGYTGDNQCTRCGQILLYGAVVPKLTDGSISKENVLSMLSKELKVDEEAKENIEHLAETSPETAIKIIDAANKTTSVLKQLKKENKITDEEYKRSITSVQDFIQITSEIGTDSIEEIKCAEEIQSNLPAKTSINFEKAISDFYEKQMELLLKTENGAIDLEQFEEQKNNIIAATETYVGQMTEAVLMIKNCTSTMMETVINQIISSISTKTYKDFDKEAADDEFAENAYQAVLLKLQSQVLSAVTQEYENEKARGSYIGTAQTQLDEKYQEEISSIQDVETFEIMVTEVMRQKYVSILNEQLSGKKISQQQYNSAIKNAEDVDTFAPIYKDIFKSWALQRENEYGVTLEELTKTAISYAKQTIKPATFSNKLTSSDKTTIALISAVILAPAVGFIVYNLLIMKKRRYANGRVF